MQQSMEEKLEIKSYRNNTNVKAAFSLGNVEESSSYRNACIEKLPS